MAKLFKKFFFSFVVLVAFSISGHFAVYLESWHESILASSAVFGATFVSLVGGSIKIWYDILA
jgi:Ni,Fe-hydrogenase I cytochrome b subunit